MEITAFIGNVTNYIFQHLKQLEADKIIIREAKPVVPPYVTYRLSTTGEGLRPVMQPMASWAIEDSEANGAAIYKNMGGFPVGSSSTANSN